MRDPMQPLEATYDPNRLLDALIKKLKLKNDAALSRVLDVNPPVLSKIRHGTLPIGASLIIRIQDVSNYRLKKLRALMGDRRATYRAVRRSNAAAQKQVE
ncbi:MAG: hypothetical protein M3N23_13135 [Pseudomonadota bacterium]|nr:hypothetical protein [Pseudomonadota bacterium]